MTCSKLQHCLLFCLDSGKMSFYEAMACGKFNCESFLEKVNCLEVWLGQGNDQNTWNWWIHNTLLPLPHTLPYSTHYHFKRHLFCFQLMHAFCFIAEVVHRHLRSLKSCKTPLVRAWITWLHQVWVWLHVPATVWRISSSPSPEGTFLSWVSRCLAPYILVVGGRGLSVSGWKACLSERNKDQNRASGRNQDYTLYSLPMGLVNFYFNCRGQKSL